MGGVDLCDQMTVSYEVDRRNKVRFYLGVFFDYMDISVVNSTTVYDKSPINRCNVIYGFSIQSSPLNDWNL